MSTAVATAYRAAAARPADVRLTAGTGLACPMCDSALSLARTGWACPACAAGWDLRGTHGTWHTTPTS